MSLVEIFLNFCRDVYKTTFSIDIQTFYNETLNGFQTIYNETLTGLVTLMYTNFKAFIAAFLIYFDPEIRIGSMFYSDYVAAEEALVQSIFEALYFILGELKVDIAEFNIQYFIGFTMDDFRFFKHHYDDPGGVDAQGGYEDVCLYAQNFGFHVSNFGEYHIVAILNDFFNDYYIEEKYLPYGILLVLGIMAVGIIYDYFQTIVEVQYHLYRVQTAQIMAITEYLRKHKVLYKTKKLQDAFEDRQYNAGGYDRELFIETLLTDKDVQDKLRNTIRPMYTSKTGDGSKIATDLRYKNVNEGQSSEAYDKPDPGKKKPIIEEDIFEEVVVDHTIDPVARKPVNSKAHKRMNEQVIFIRKGMLADAIHLFEIFDSKQFRFGIIIGQLYDLPRNLVRLFTLFYGGYKALKATTGPTKGTHFDVDYKIALDLFSVLQGEDSLRVMFNRGVLNFIYDFYVTEFKDSTVDVTVVLDRYIEYKLRNTGLYKRVIMRRTMKHETLFYFGLRLSFVLDLLELKGPFLLYIRRTKVLILNTLRFMLLYVLRIGGRLLKMPLIESIDEFLVRNRLKRVISPLEEASCFGYVPSNARNDVIGYIEYLDKHKIKHLYHVSYYKGGKKKSYIDGLKDLFGQFFYIDILFGINFVYNKGIEPFWVHKYDMSFRFTLHGSFDTYIGARLYIPFISFVRRFIFKPFNLAIKNFFRKTGTGEMYIFITVLRLGYETPIYSLYKYISNMYFYRNDSDMYAADLPIDVKVNSKYTRKMSLETMAGKNKNGFVFYAPIFLYHVDYMKDMLYMLFDEDDEEEYTHEEDGLETDYREDHDTLLETDFQLRKNGYRDMNAGYALIHEEMGLGLKHHRIYDFYENSEKLYGKNINKENIFLSGIPKIQNISKPVREAFRKQKNEHYMPKKSYNPYNHTHHTKNGTKSYHYDDDITLMEKEALYLLYFHVNSPVNGFFTPGGEVDDGSYYSFNTMTKDADEFLNEEEYLVYEYAARYAYGPSGRYLDEIPTMLYQPEVRLIGKAKRNGEIPKGGNRIGKGSYHKSLTGPLKYSIAIEAVNDCFGANRYAKNLLDLGINVNESDNKKDIPEGSVESEESVNKIVGSAGVIGSESVENTKVEENNELVPDINIKIRKRFEVFLAEHKELQDEFNELMRDSYTNDQLNSYKYAERLFIGTDTYLNEIKNFKEHQDFFKKYYGLFKDKLNDKSDKN